MGKSVTLTLAFVVFTVVVVLIAFWIHQLKRRIMEERLTYIRSVLTPKMYAEFLDICKNTKIHQLKRRIMDERLSYIRSVLTPKMYEEFLDICKNTKNDVYKLVEEAYIKLKNQEAFLDMNE